MGIQSYKFPVDFLNNLEKPVIYIGNKYKNIVGSVSVYDGLKFTFNLNAFQTVEFKVYRDIDSKKQEYFDAFEEGMLIMIPGIAWYEIHVETNIEPTGISKSISGTSLECKLCDKRLVDFQVNSDDFEDDDYVVTKFYNPTDPKKSLLDRVLNVAPNWSVGHVDQSLVDKQRTFNEDDVNVYSFLTETAAEAFNCLFVFDTFNQTVNAYDLDTYGKDTDIFVSMDNLAQNMTQTIDQRSIFTCYRVKGGDGVYINEVNPNGTDKIYDFSYYLSQMPEELQQKLIDYNYTYQILMPIYEEVVAAVQEQLEKIYELLDRVPDSLASTDWTQYGLELLQSQEKSLITQEELYCAQGYNIPADIHYDLYKQNHQKLNEVQSEIAVRESEIESARNEYEETCEGLTALQNVFDMDNWFTEDEWLILDDYVIEETYSNDNFSVVDNTNEAELFSMEKELFDKACEDLSKKCRPQYQYSATLTNLLTIPEFKDFVKYFELGNFIRMETDYDTIVRLRLISFTIDYTNMRTIDVTFSDAIRVKDIYEDTASILAQANSLASSFKFRKDQYDNSVKQGNFVAEMRKYGLDVATVAIHNATDQSQTWDSTGMTFRKWNDERQDYDPEMIKIINNMMVFLDGENGARMAIGKLKLPNGNSCYGINCELLANKLTMSENVWIENDSGTYKFDDDGFNASNGTNIVKIQPGNSGELFSIYKGSDKQFYITSDGDVEYAGTLRGSTGVFSGLLQGGSINIGNNSFTVDENGIFSLAGGRLKFDGKTMSFGSDVTLSWGQITGTGNVASKNDIPTDISQLNDAYGQKWSTTIGENWIRTSTVTAQNLNVQNLDTVNSNGYVKAKTSNQYAALEVACADEGAGIRIYNGTKNGSSWNPIYGTYCQISSMGIAFYENYNNKVMKLSARSGLDMNNHSITNCLSINLISDTIPTSTSRDSNKAPSYTACASMISNLKALIPSTSSFAPADHSHRNYVSSVSVSSSGSTGTKFVHDASISGNTLYLTRYVYSASDIRLKQNVTDLPDLTQIYMQLEPKKFKYSDVLKGYSKDWKFGLIAQDMERLFYEANIPIEETGLITLEQSDPVFNEDKLVGDDVVHRINYDQFHMMHIQMIQKQQEEIDGLQSEVNDLKQEVADLKQLVNKLLERDSV